MTRHRMRNMVPPVFGILVLLGFVISATVGVFVAVFGGLLVGVLWAALSGPRSGRTAANRR
jgi:membrane associated rhomboid family serine protease